jgi:AcrR family transcriptional regulator
MEMLSQQPDQPFSHELIAEKAGMGTRTVYRHFPSRADLLQALWERLRETTQTRFPQNEEEIPDLTRTVFRNFDRHEAIVRASLASEANAEVRNRGAVEGRHAFRKSLARVLDGATPEEQRRLLAVCLAIYSAPFWQLLRDRGQLSGREAQEAAAWALEALITKSRKEQKTRKEHNRK